MDAWERLFFVVIVVVITVCGVVGFQTVHSSGRPDYCFLNTQQGIPGAVLTMHRPWRPNSPVQVVKDAAEAAAAAQAVGCTLH